MCQPWPRPPSRPWEIERAHGSTTEKNGDVLLAGSADHLSSLEEQRWGNSQAQNLGGLELDG